MKKILNIRMLIKSTVLTLTSVLIMSSCVKEDLLDRNDPSAVDEEKAWTTPYLTKLGMNGVYSGLRLGTDGANGATSREIYGYDQFVTSQTLSNGGNREILWGGASTANGLFANVWKDLYEGLSRASDAIVNIPVKSECKPEDKARYVAEAKFLRAFFYHRLNQLYKGVPIYEVPITMEDCMRPRNTEKEVWDFIIKDLTDCINEANLPNKYQPGNADFGRVTKGAAYALRGKVYMYTKEYQKAIDDFDEVKTCGYDLYNGDYKSLFIEANEQCEEVIFSLQNIELDKHGSSQHFHCGTRSSFGSCWNTFGVTASVVDSYDNLDGSEFSWENHIPGYTAMKPSDREVYFLRDTLGIRDKLFATGEFKDLTEAGISATIIVDKVNARLSKFSPAIKALYLDNGNEARIRQAYLNRDPRLEKSIITPYAKYLGALNGTEDHEVVMRWPYCIENRGVDDLKSDNSGDLYYFHRKFVFEGSAMTLRGDSPIDLPLLRYADIVLMQAEAYAELNNLPKAISLVNLIRARAGVGLLNSSPGTTVSSKTQVVDRIRKERRIELLNEGTSYFDELRWGTWEQTVFKKDKHGNEPGRQQAYGNAQRSYSYDGNKLMTWPIPASEREMNASLTQNTGW